jgi:hypothetical protein
MNNKVLLLIPVILLSFLMSCSTDVKQPPTPVYPEASMTPERVVNIALVYGNNALSGIIPSNLQPIGQWGAVYEGGGVWRIKGYYSGNLVNYEVIWTYSNNKLTFVSYNNIRK